MQSSIYKGWLPFSFTTWDKVLKKYKSNSGSIYTFSLNYKLNIKHQFMEKWEPSSPYWKQKKKPKTTPNIITVTTPTQPAKFCSEDHLHNFQLQQIQAFLHMALLYSINTGSVFICSFFISLPHMTSNKIGSSATHTTLKHNFEHNCIQNRQIHIGPHASNDTGHSNIWNCALKLCE